jgi:PAS domain S-box-containing protein
MDPLPREEALGVSLSSPSSLHLLIEKIPAILWTADMHLRITSLAGSGLAASNIRPDDYLGRPLEEFLHALSSNEGAVMAHHRALHGHTSAFQGTAGGRDLKGHVEPLREANGNIVGVIGVALDNTDFRVAERALQISEQNYRSLFEEAPYGICRSTLSGQLLQVNRAMVEMLGYASEEDLLLRDLGREIFQDEVMYRDFLDKTLRTTSHQGFECSWRRQPAAELIVRLGGRAVRDEHGEVLYVQILAENVTELKQLEEQLRQGQKMQAIGQLAGGIAHDFNNLLTVIKGHIERMLSEPKQAQSGALQEVQKAADRARMLTQHLLTFSRRQLLDTKVLDLNHVISGASQILARLIGENIELRFVPGPHVGTVRADRAQLEQVLMNLVVNARDAIQGIGTITIRTENVTLKADSVRRGIRTPAGDYVALIINDTGQGMDSETVAHIFEPFFTTKKDQGTGLGLATVYGVVKQSDGFIWVHSVPGQGTTFEIYFPRASAPADTRRAAAPPTFTGGSETILFVEDDPGVRELISEFLSAKGYHVLTATNGVSALELVRSFTGTIDLLVSDLCMPKMGGIELAAQLKGSRPEVRVLFVSGYPGDDVVEKPVASAGAPILQKPFDMRYLASAVRCVLDGIEVPSLPQ